MSSCPINIGGGPANIVNSTLADARSFAGSAFSEAGRAIDALSSFSVEPITSRVALNFNGIFDAYTRPVFRGDDRFSDVADLTVVDDPKTRSIHDPRLDGQPGEPGDAPNLYYDPKPGAFSGSAPPAPGLDPVTVPDKPELNLPGEPDLEDIDLSDLSLPEINLPEFDFIAPSDDEIPDINAAFHFTNERYSSDLIDKIKEKICYAFDTGTGLPVAVENALFSRALDRQEQNAQRQRQTIRREFSARGHSEPPGALRAALREVEQDISNKRSDLNREQFVNRFQQEIEEVRYYTAQGIALEGELIREHIAYMDRALQAARAILDASIAIFNAYVQRYNLSIQLYQAQLVGYRAEVEAELAKLEEYRARIEAKKLIAEVNEQEVNVYEARLRGVLAVVQLYQGEIDAAKLLASLNGERVDVFRGQVEAYRAEVQAKEAEFRAWGEGVRGEVAKVDAYAREVDAYAARVQAWRVGADAEIALTQADVQINEQYLREWQTRIAHARSILDGDIAKLDSDLRQYEALVRKYEVDGQVEQVASAANDRSLQIALETAREKTRVDLQNAQINIESANNANSLALSALDSIGQVSASLASSALSALNVSASIRGSSSDSVSCETVYNVNE